MDSRKLLKKVAMLKTQKKSVNGFTVVELLIALAITAMLLGAVAAAFNASVINYQENEDIFKAMNKARQSLFRITTQLRTAAGVDPNAPANECTLLTSDGNDITYRYNSSEKKLYLDMDSQAYLLCDNVSTMTFEKITGVNADGDTYVKNVQILMTVISGNITKTISAAAVIRRNVDEYL